MASVLIPLAAGCEEVEAVTLIDLLRRAGLEVVAAGLDPGPVRASRGVVLLPDVELSAVVSRDFDMVVLPGGKEGAERLSRDARIGEMLKRHHAQGKWIAAICAAPMVFAKAGLLHGRKATAYPGVLDALDLKDTELTGAAVQIDGRIATSRGPGTAMDFALALIELLLGKDSRSAVEEALQRSTPSNLRHSEVAA